MRPFALVLLLLAMIVHPSWGQDDVYQLGTDDQIQVQVWQRPDLTGTYTVDTDGYVTLPLLGSVRAAGFTPQDLSKELERRYSILDASISEVLVSITQFASLFVNVVGEVRAPGRQVFREPPTVWDAILSAGGQTPGADMSRVQVVRKASSGSAATTITVDLSRGLEGTSLTSLPDLKTGDSIVVPSLTDSFLPGGDKVNILGAVTRPGAYPVQGSESLVEALSISGGATANADLRKVSLSRPGANGVTVYHIDLQGYLTQGSPMENMELRPGDTVNIPQRESGGDRFLRVVLQIVPLLTAVSSLIIISRELSN